MCEIFAQNRLYPLFDGYELDTNRSAIRYSVFCDKPLNCKIRTKAIKTCECGCQLVPLAYKFNNGNECSRVLLGRKCIGCGNNYFTEKTMEIFPQGFSIDHTERCNDIIVQKEFEIKRGDIFYADLKGIESWCGSEQTGYRPVLIIQNNKTNYVSNTTIIAVITSKHKRNIPTHVTLPSILPMQSYVCMEQIKTIDKNRLGNYIGNIFEEDQNIENKINKAIRLSLELQ